EDLRELLRGLFVLGREWPAAALVDELEHAEQVLLEEDGARQPLACREARGRVRARVELEARVEARQLGGIVGVLDVRRLSREGGETREGGEGLRDADLLDLLARLEEGKELLVTRVEGEDRHALGVDEIEDPVL